MRHDFYRPCSLHRLAGGLDGDGRIVALAHAVTAPSIMESVRPGSVGEGPDEALLRGVADSPYTPPAFRAEQALVPTAIPLGWWRGVFDVQNAWAQECFLDELAQAAGRDPVELRLEMLPPGARLRRVVVEAADRAGWPRPSVPGRHVGFACHACFGSVNAQVAEISWQNGRLRVHRVVSVLECGPVVNPDAVRAQMEGGVAMGLGVALRERITWAQGRVQQANFDDYEPLRLPEMPVVETHILTSDQPIGGVGEPVLPPTAPAVCNALFAATGERRRELPLSLG
jgi:CO/xanthine dehydrogenase Mo-binding subunit